MSQLRMRCVVGLCVCLGWWGATALAGTEKPAAQEGGAAAKADALEPFRKLAGTWVGKFGEGADARETEITYRVIAAGSAVVEELFKGTPHEMVTVYFLDGEQLMLTHYCAAKNQPQMKAVKCEPHEVQFDFVGGTNIDPAKTGHMHSAHFRFLSDDEFEVKWQYFEDGKAADHAAYFRMKRKAGA